MSITLLDYNVEDNSVKFVHLDEDFILRAYKLFLKCKNWHGNCGKVGVAFRFQQLLKSDVPHVYEEHIR